MSHSMLLKSISIGTNTLHKTATLSKHGSVTTPTKARFLNPEADHGHLHQRIQMNNFVKVTTLPTKNVCGIPGCQSTDWICPEAL